jgi:hypothetical protein
MPARRCDENKIRSGKLRASHPYSGWERALQPRSAGLAGHLQAVAVHRAEEEEEVW